jgi:hypothetical protein
MKLPALPIGSHQDATLNFQSLRKEANAPWKPASLLGFEHAWVVYEAGKRLPEYRKVGHVVEMRGIMKAGESGRSAFVLPEGYRPKEEKVFLASAQEVAKFGRIQITSTGEVTPENGTGEVKVFVYLDAVRFAVD